MFFLEMNVVPRPDVAVFVDGFTLLSSMLLHCGAVLREL